MNLQEAFLNIVRVQKIPVSIFLTGGHQMKGVVTGFDSFILLLDSGGKQNLIYKHAVASIMPMKPVVFSKGGEGAQKEKTAGPAEQPANETVTRGAEEGNNGKAR